MPGGVSRNTVFKKPHPHYAAFAKGCYVTDIDGTKRIDFANNMAALIHGHAHPAINEAVIKQIERGTAYTMATEAELEHAQHIIGRSNSFEKIRFTNSGTEAVMGMIKAARAFTGKPKIAKAEGAYHGTYDFAEVSQAPNPDNWGSIEKPNSVPLAYGTPKGVTDNVIIFPYNDIERTLAILDENAGELACVIIDLAPHRVGLCPANVEYVEAVYNWTRKNNALLAFDEVVTFRVNYGGAQQSYNVRPDLTALGKIIGGGYPVGAIVGKSEVMKVLDPSEPKTLLPYSGTFSANPVSMTAGRVAMELYDKNAVAELNKLTQVAIKQINQAIKVADIPVSLTGAGSMFRLHLKEKSPTTHREAYQNHEERQLINEILDYLFYHENIMMINTCACMFSTVITQQEVDHLSDAFLNVFKYIKPKLELLKPATI